MAQFFKGGKNGHFAEAIAKQNSHKWSILGLNRFLLSKETVVLRRWERSKQKFAFIKRVDKG